MKKQLIFNYPNLILAIISLISIFFITYYLKSGVFDNGFFAVLVFGGFAWFAVLADKLLKLKLKPLLMVIYYLFLILAIFFGYILHFNRYFSWYRNLIHFFAGIFSSIIGIYLIVRLDNIGYLKFSVLFTYSLFFSGFVTSLWTIASALLVDFFGYSSSGTIIRVGMGLIGAACFSVLLILDYLIYHSRYLEKLIQKL